MSKKLIKYALTQSVVLALLLPSLGFSQPHKIKLTIKVTKDETTQLVRRAKVHVASIESSPRVQRDKTTNKNGVVILRKVPAGKYRIQVTGRGWETFGGDYEINQNQQLIEIKLKPRRS